MGDELLVVADKMVDDVAKACELSDVNILGVKKGKDGFEGLVCGRPLTEGLSPILLGDFVTLEQGTGCVHIAPGHGMEDYLLALKYNANASSQILKEPIQVVVPVDDRGCFTDDFEVLAGEHLSLIHI